MSHQIVPCCAVHVVLDHHATLLYRTALHVHDKAVRSSALATYGRGQIRVRRVECRTLATAGPGGATGGSRLGGDGRLGVRQSRTPAVGKGKPVQSPLERGESIETNRRLTEDSLVDYDVL